MSFDHRPCQKLNSLKHYKTHAHDCMDAGGRATQDAKAEHYCIFQRCPRTGLIENNAVRTNYFGD